MFVDASALVAFATEEDDALILLEVLERADLRFTSPVAVLEATMAIARERKLQPVEACAALQRLLVRSNIDVCDIPASLTSEVVEVYARYGKGQSSGAKLNMGDCFAYAMARHLGVPLLYKGEDFARTDLA